MGLNELVTSKGYVNFMTKLYGWGASVVIIGALFKIMHWPGAGIVLTAGMVTEALIFFFSAFEPPLPHYNWSLVFPQLAIGEEAHDTKDKKAMKLPSNAPITQQLDNALTEAKIGTELLESLASGMRNLGENAKSSPVSPMPPQPPTDMSPTFPRLPIPSRTSPAPTTVLLRLWTTPPPSPASISRTLRRPPLQ